MRSFDGKRRLPVFIAIEAGAPLDELSNVARTVLDQGGDGALVAQAVPRRHRVGAVQLRGIAGTHGGALKVSVNAPPERGKANDAVVALLSDLLDAAVEITAGTASQDKTVFVALDGETIRRRLSEREPKA